MTIINGFLKMPIAEFDAFNAAALTWQQDYDATSYTYYFTASNELECWARVEGRLTWSEQDYIDNGVHNEFVVEGLTQEQRNNIKTQEEAVALGMSIFDEYI